MDKERSGLDPSITGWTMDKGTSNRKDYMEYPKIETLFERDPNTFVVDPTRLKKSVLGTIREWDVTEKVDGTNIRVTYNPMIVAPDSPISSPGPVVKFNGRTDNAQIPGDLIQYLIKTFPPGLFEPSFQAPVILYGEGYGAGIQKVGKLYKPDKGFILFDVLIDGQWWLDTKQVSDVAEKLGISSVPYLFRGTLDDIVKQVQTGFPSEIGDLPAEGIVARPIETLFDKRHERIIIKLKTKDFVSGKR
jgi:hypothetical protein